MKIIDIPQRTPDWHRWRNQGVSASEAIVVLGNYPEKTRFRLYAEKKGLILPDNLDANPNIQRGIRLEPVARRSFEARHGVFLLPICAQNDLYPFMRASFDGVDDNGIPVELKAPCEELFHDAVLNGTGSEVYQRYYPQVQQQILVAGSKKAWLSLYLSPNEIIDFEIFRDDDFINSLVFEATSFYNCLVNNQPPEKNPELDIFIPSGMDLDKWNNLAADYHCAAQLIDEFNQKIKPLKDEQVKIEQAFLTLMGDFAQAETAGLRLNRYMQQGSIDYKAALLALHPDLDPAFLEKFRKDSSERTRLTIKSEDKASVPFSMEQIMSVNQVDFWF